MGGNKSPTRADGFTTFILKIAGTIACVFGVGIAFAFINDNIWILVFTLIIDTALFIQLLTKWDAHKKGKIHFVIAVCVNIEHVSAFHTDYVMETVPEDEETEPKIFTLTMKRTRFRLFVQGVPYILGFGRKKDSFEYSVENLITYSKRPETYNEGQPGRGIIDLDTIPGGEMPEGAAEEKPEAENKDSSEIPLPRFRAATKEEDVEKPEDWRREG